MVYVHKRNIFHLNFFQITYSLPQNLTVRKDWVTKKADYDIVSIIISNYFFIKGEQNNG